MHEEVELAKKGVNVTFSQLLLDGGESVWVSRTTVLVPARHKYGKAAGEGRANKGKPTTLVEDAEADGCVIAVVVAVGHALDRCFTRFTRTLLLTHPPTTNDDPTAGCARSW